MAENNAMAENFPYRVQDENGIIQFKTMMEALQCIQSDPEKLGFIVDNASGKIVTIWMRDTAGVGDVWIWNHSPEFKHDVQFWLKELEQEETDDTGVPKKYREEIETLIKGRGGEKIYERLIEEVWDYIADNCSYPFEAEDDEETATAIQDYAFKVFKEEYLSSVDHYVPGTVSVKPLDENKGEEGR